MRQARALLFAVAVVAALGMAAPAAAVPVIDFGTGYAGPGGVVSVNNQVITGEGILLDALFVSGALVNNGPYDLTGTGAGAVGSTAVLNFGYGNGVNYINVVGGVPGMGIPDGTILLSGTFATFDFTPGIAFHGTGLDVKDAGLLAFLGLPVNQKFDFFGFSIGIDPTPGGGFTASSTDVQNTAVPEPASLLLLGTGLIGLARLRRRRG